MKTLDTLQQEEPLTKLELRSWGYKNLISQLTTEQMVELKNIAIEQAKKINWESLPLSNLNETIEASFPESEFEEYDNAFMEKLVEFVYGNINK